MKDIFFAKFATLKNLLINLKKLLKLNKNKDTTNTNTL